MNGALLLLVLVSAAAAEKPPQQLRQDLQHRGCKAPASVIRGHFRTPEQWDWAALCEAHGASSILVYWSGSASHPAILGKAPLLPDRCGRSIGVVGRDFILKHYKAYGGPKPPPIDHQGIDIGICESVSTVSYFYRNRWLTLTGSD